MPRDELLVDVTIVQGPGWCDPRAILGTPEREPWVDLDLQSCRNGWQGPSCEVPDAT